MDHLVKIYQHASQPHKALHGITPAVVSRAPLLRRASGNFLFKNHRFDAKIDNFLSPSAFRLTSDFSHFLRHYVQLWRVLLSLINP